MITKPLLSQTPPNYTSYVGYVAMMEWYDNALARMPVPFHTDMIPTRFGGTHVIIAGQSSGPPLLLIHGANTSALSWKRLIEPLAQRHLVIAPDVVGFAGRSAPERLSYHDDSYARWIEDILDAFGLGQTFLAGSSGGGVFVLKAAVHIPDRVAGLALLNPCGFVPFKQPYEVFRTPVLSGLAVRTGRWFASAGLARRMVAYGAGNGAKADAETVQLSLLLLKHFKRHPPPGPMGESDLCRVMAPTLVLLGEDEPYFDVHRLSERAQQTLQNVTVEIIAGAGHDPQRDQAEAVHRILRAFFWNIDWE